MEKDILKAAKIGDVQKVRELLAVNPELLKTVDAEGAGLLHFAVWKGHPELVDFLIAAGADVNAHSRMGHWGTTPLHAAAHANQAAIAEKLIAAGADVNAVDLEGNTPLVHTTYHKAKAAAKVIEAHGGHA